MGDHACAVRIDGTIACWGHGEYGQTSAPEDGRFVDVTSGRNHTCAWRKDGTPVCWGLNATPFSISWLGQASPPERERYRVISAGSNFTCGLGLDGALACWGEDYDIPEPENTE